MFEVGYISALIGGLLTFFAPCTLPLVPAYISFLAGTPKNGAIPQRKKILVNAALFVSAFSLVFIFFGMIGGAVGAFFVLHRAFVSRLGGIVVIILGLSMLGLFDIPQLFAGRRLPSILTAGKPSSAFLLGLLFALGWSPCLGPVLGTILVLAGASATVFHGALLLFIYSLGLAIPFLIIALVYGASFSYVTAIAKVLPYINKIGGALFILIGVLLLLGDFGLLNVWATDVFGDSWYVSLMERM